MLRGEEAVGVEGEMGRNTAAPEGVVEARVMATLEDTHPEVVVQAKGREAPRG
jgi:hypothetical protein